MDCPGALTRAIPGHHDATANHRNVSGVGNNQHWPAGSQNDLFLYFCLYRGLVRVCPTDDHEVCVLCGEHHTVGGSTLHSPPLAHDTEFGGMIAEVCLCLARLLFQAEIVFGKTFPAGSGGDPLEEWPARHRVYGSQVRPVALGESHREVRARRGAIASSVVQENVLDSHRTPPPQSSRYKRSR